MIEVQSSFFARQTKRIPSLQPSIKSFLISGFLAIAFFAVLFAADAQAVGNVASPALLLPASGASFDSPRLLISGTAQGADEVQVFIDEVFNGTAKVAEGAFLYYPFLPLSSGSHSIGLRAKDSSTGVVSDFSEFINIFISPNPSPTLLVPDEGAKLGQDRAWVGGVAKNNSLIIVSVDGVEWARANVKNHASGTGSFGVSLPNLALGEHVVSAVARDARGKDSYPSAERVINIVMPTPAPVLIRPIVNADSGIERPFVSGVAKNGLAVSIIINDKIAATIAPEPQASGTASFAWQVENPLSLGRHKIEAFASDGGKLSNNSEAIYWQVGELSETLGKVDSGETAPNAVKQPTEELPLGAGGNPDEGKDMELPLTVKEDLQNKEEPLAIKEESPEEKPVVPDEVKESPAADIGNMDKSADDAEGRVNADDDQPKIVVKADDSAKDQSQTEEPKKEEKSEVKEISPGAVVKKDAASAKEFKFNTSLIIGIVILVFLLLSILVWYIQEKKEQLGDKVVNIFKENDDADSGADAGVDADSSDAVFPENNKLPGDINMPDEDEIADYFGPMDEPPPPEEIIFPEEPYHKFPRPSKDDDLPPPPPPMF